MQETLVPSLGQEDPLKKETATHCRVLAWEILWREKPGYRHNLLSEQQQTEALKFWNLPQITQLLIENRENQAYPLLPAQPRYLWYYPTQAKESKIY